MKEFLKTNTVTYNLMSFTGFKSILIFSLLLESPKSYSEIQEFIKNNEYLNEEISIDAIRIYLNSLREIGCNIIKVHDGNVTKYSIDSHPFQLNLNEKQVNDIIKIYGIISKSIEINDLIILHELFIKISNYIANEDLKFKLLKLSPISNLDSNLLKNLILYSEEKKEITIYYNSSTSGYKNINVIVDSLIINNGKLYLKGYSSTYQNYASFLVSKILKIVSVNLESEKVVSSEYIVRYSYNRAINEKFELQENENIIEEKESEIIVEITSHSKFDILQRIMSHANKVKILFPSEFKNYVVSILKEMKEGYIEK